MNSDRIKLLLNNKIKENKGYSDGLEKVIEIVDLNNNFETAINGVNTLISLTKQDISDSDYCTTEDFYNLEYLQGLIYGKQIIEVVEKFNVSENTTVFEKVDGSKINLQELIDFLKIECIKDIYSSVETILGEILTNESYLKFTEIYNRE